MRLLKCHFLQALPFFSLVSFLFICGCATTTPQNLFTVAGPDWRVRQGQALWTPRRGAPQFGGDLVVASDSNGRYFVQFEKVPLSLVSAEVTPDRWQIRFPQGGGFWKGHQPAPTRTIWLYLPAALAGKILPAPLSFGKEPNGNWRLENMATGESLEGFLSS